MTAASVSGFPLGSAAIIVNGIEIMAKNYYAILGVMPDATPEDIRGAYRKRVKKLHPDHYGENSNPFLEVQEAYGVLSDPGCRRDYDRSLRKHRVHAEAMSPAEIETLRPSRDRVEPLRDRDRLTDLGEIYLHRSFRTGRPSFEGIFDRIRSNFGATENYKSERLQNLCLEIILTPDEARRGGRMGIVLPSRTAFRTAPEPFGRVAAAPPAKRISRVALAARGSLYSAKLACLDLNLPRFDFLGFLFGRNNLP